MGFPSIGCESSSLRTTSPGLREQWGPSVLSSKPERLLLSSSRAGVLQLRGILSFALRHITDHLPA